MRLRNNITPKNSVRMIVSGKNNIIDPRVRNGIISGDGNVIGDSENVTIIGSSGNIIGAGCSNVVLVNSFDCEVSPGLSNVSLNASSGIVVSSGDITYEGNAYQFNTRLQSSSGVKAGIQTLRVQLDNGTVLALAGTPFELLPAQTGYFIDVITAQVSVPAAPALGGVGVSLIIFNGAESQIDFGTVLQNAVASISIYNGDKITTTSNQQYKTGGNLNIAASGGSPTGTGELIIYITYQYIQA